MPWYVFAFLAAVLTGLETVFEKKAVTDQKPIDFSIAYVGVTTILGALVLSPWTNFTPSVEFLKIVYLSSVFMAIGIILWMKSIQHLPMVVVAPQSVVSAVFTIGLAVLFLGEKLSWVQIGGIAIILAASIVLSLTGKGGDHPSHFPMSRKKLDGETRSFWLNEALLILSMLCFSISAVMEKDALKFESPITLIVLAPLGALVNLLLYYVMFHGNPTYILKVFKEEKGLMGYLGTSLVFSRYFYTQAISMAELAVVFPVRRLSVLISTIVGGRMEKDNKLWLHSLLAVIMLIGVWLVVK